MITIAMKKKLEKLGYAKEIHNMTPMQAHNILEANTGLSRLLAWFRR